MTDTELPWEAGGEAALKSLSTNAVGRLLATVLLSRPELVRRVPEITKKIEEMGSVIDPVEQASLLDDMGSSSFHVARSSTIDVLSLLEASGSQCEDRLADCILQFSTAVYYAKEGEDDNIAVLDVMRLGPDTEEVSCSYRTQDSDGKAGFRYASVSGDLTFARGEVMKQVRVPIIAAPSWTASLEFKVILSDPKGCALGRYLYMCRVKVIDPDCFPTDRFAKQIRANAFSSIPMGGLLWEYFKFNYRSCHLIHNRTIVQIIQDQLGNVYSVWKIYLQKVLIDKVLNIKACSPGEYVLFGMLLSCPEGDEAARLEERKGLLLFFCLFITIPFFFVHWLDFREVFFKIGGTSRKTLQGNIVRKFLNYDESARSKVSFSDMIMAITRDVDVVVSCGYMKVFGILRNLGLLLGMLFLQMANKAFLAGAIVFVYPLILCTVLYVRNHKTWVVASRTNDSQNKLVNHTAQIMANFRLIGDYNKRPVSELAHEDLIGKYNANLVASDAIRLNSSFCCDWLSLLLIGIWYVVGGHMVLSGGDIGIFVMNMNVFKEVGSSWKEIYGHLITVQNSLPYLIKITRYLNLPIDLDKRMELNRKRRSMGEQLRVAARQAMDKERAAGKDLLGAFAADYVPISVEGIGFSFESPSTIYHHSIDDKKGSGAPVFQQGIKNITFSFPQGSFVALVGSPRDGKTTMMKILGSQLLPDTGDLLIPPHLRALHISSPPAFFAESMYKNLTYGVGQGDRDGSPERVLAICKRLGVSERVLKYLDKNDEQLFNVRADWLNVLSQTQKALLSLARGLIANPEILVIHKPTNVLNDALTRNVYALLRETVVNKGLCLDKATRPFRRPRTVVITTVRERGVAAADYVIKITPTEAMRVYPGKRSNGIKEEDLR